MKKEDILTVNGSKLSSIVFGAAGISGEGGGYGFGEISENDSIDLLNLGYSEGLNFIDTAPIYGFGTSEERIGKAFKSNRDEVFICSKAGVDWHETKRVNMTNDPKSVVRMFDESRTRLQSDYIDLYMIHWPDEKVDIRESVDVLLKLKEEKKIRYIGLCNTHNSDLDLVREYIDFVQSEFNYFNNALKDVNTENKITMGWGTFDKGILSGSVTADRVFDKSDCRSWAPWWKDSDWKERVLKAQELAESIVPKTLKDFSIEYSLKNLDFCMIGFKKKHHLEGIAKHL